jgi:hypothetical protein
LITFPFDGIDKAPNLKTLVLDSIAATLLGGVGAARSVVNLNVASNRLTSLPEELSNLPERAQCWRESDFRPDSHLVERATVIDGLESIQKSA